ncbi:MAG: hypothetical protein JGK40_02695 [Microcoleus sp. PH2017_21_RUC_O_A]|uniref:hypothetical protein n=1 Tax=Microcoleus sp. PH2017_21_RUC_O_A TaxID=2798832 RepID=UPI001DB18840|nr:hypothetical protein [Microcoleus sp. PH2017_21_RUC_O_A]MCC3527006.1 hypothetical protein [Microcoleus sp. PH2017_21_RUC_O_A]
MLIKLPSIKSISKFSAVCALAFSLVLGGANIDTAKARDLESRTQAVDRFADWFFYKVNPQLGGRKLRSDDSPVYIREWNAIRRTVDREMIATPGDCVGDAFWDFDYRFHGRSLVSGALEEDRIADTIWTIRDPSGDKTRGDVSKQEWKKLRQSIFREHFCY